MRVATELSTVYRWKKEAEENTRKYQEGLRRRDVPRTEFDNIGVSKSPSKSDNKVWLLQFRFQVTFLKLSSFSDIVICLNRLKGVLLPLRLHY